MDGFRRRTYHNLSEFFADFKAILTRRDQMRPLMRGELIDAAFRERLMMAVTGVNQCRYCSYVHTKQALVEGISDEEIVALQQGDWENSPAEEVPALLYAQHWAETRGQPDAEAREQLVDRYGQATVKAIDLALRTIQMGNLMGNTLDYALYRVSGGRWGVDKPATPEGERPGKP